MYKLYEKMENPKESFRELLGERKIDEADLERINKSLDKKVEENKLPTFAELKNLALRASAKSEMDAGKEAFLTSTKDEIAKFAKENDTFFSKRQYADIMTRAKDSMSPLEVRMDLYKVSQVNNMTNAFMEQLKDNNIPTSKRFEDTLAQNIERQKLSVESAQSVMDKTIERLQERKFEIEKKSFGNENVKMNDTDFVIDGMLAGRITEWDNTITATMNTLKKDDIPIFEMSKDENGNYKNKDSKILTENEAVELAENSLRNAINTDRVIGAFRMEVSEYIESKQAEKNWEKYMTTKFPKENEQELKRQIEEKLPEGKHEPEKEVGGIEL
jgi:hypothetical protein